MSRKIFIIMLLLNLLYTAGLFSGELEPDADTVLLLHFNGQTISSGGIEPLEQKEIEFAPGIHQGGLRIRRSGSPYTGGKLTYPLPDSFNPAEGTVEFWLKPQWLGTEFYSMQAFNLGEIRVQVNVPGNMNLYMLQPENEQGYYPVAQWENSDWHHIAATWSIPGEMKLYVDGVLVNKNRADAKDLLKALPDYFHIGSVLPSENMDAVIDEFRISSRARSAREIAESVLAADFTTAGIEFEHGEVRLQPGWEYTPRITIASDIGISYLPGAAADWEIENPEIARITSEGTIIAQKGGQTLFHARYADFRLEGSLQVDTIYYPMEKSTPVGSDESFLNTPAADALFVLPVVIVEYIPTTDGINTEPNSAGDRFSLENMNTRMTVYNQRVKFMYEEGSRYHGYKDDTTLPAMGVKVVDRIRIYEHMPMSSTMCGWHEGYYYPDYHEVMSRIDSEYYVNTLGVKEFWVWYSGYEINGKGYELPESNMSSPLTGDISNSTRDNNDLPVYDSAYLLYQFDWALTHGFAIHNQGHQIESMLGHVNRLQDGNEHLFFRKFCGMDETDTWTPGRCGWTHMPPNTGDHYIYDSPVSVLSDCEDWNPENSGQKKTVNAKTWERLTYTWPEEPAGWTPEGSPYHLDWVKPEINFYIYWRQNIPGHDSRIIYDGGRKEITNWWQFYAEWDESIQAGMGLYKNLQ